MARQIVANISISGDPDVVAEALAAHLKRFWDPRMLSEFLDHVDATDEPAGTVLGRASEILKGD